MPLLQSLNNLSDESCFALFHGRGDRLCITVIDGTSESLIDTASFHGLNLKRFITIFSNVFGKKLKAVILHLSGLDIHEFENNLDLCSAFRTKLNALNIPHYFSSNMQIICGQIIAKANITTLKYGDKIVCGFINHLGIGFAEYEYTENGYARLDFNRFAATDKHDEICDKIIDFSKTQKLVIIEGPEGNALFKSLKNLLNLKNLIFIEKDELNIKFLAEMSKWLLDKSHRKSFVIPTCDEIYRVLDSCSGVWLGASTGTLLPFEEINVVPKSVCVLLECQIACEKPKNIIHKMEQKCHRNRIILSVDEENFQTFSIEPFLLDEIKNLPIRLNEMVKSKIPIIGFCDSFSVMCIYNVNKNGYEFVDGWNGVYGNELVINFCNEKPLYCDQALSASNSTISFDLNQNGKDIFTIPEPKKPIFGATKNKPFLLAKEKDGFIPGSLVYELINIMSMPPDKIKIEDFWGFTITKDDENPVLLEFMNHEKKLKAASPPFLMALLLKQHIKVIKAEIGEKPAKVGFCILDEDYCNEGKERIRDGLEEACKLLKIGFEFFDV